MVGTALALTIGFLAGIWFGVQLAIRTGFVDKVVARIGITVMHEHRAYRLALVSQVGSTDEADRLMTTYRETEDL